MNRGGHDQGFITAELRPGEPVAAALQGAVVAIGNFDGVHRGHQAVLCEALEKGAELGCATIVLTFEPHPRSFFKPAEPVFRLTPSPLRATLLELAGCDGVVECTFDTDFAAQTASTFVERIVVEQLAARHVVTGHDFHFGKGRQGGPNFLATAGDEAGFGVTLVEAFSDENGDIVSSSRIRSALADGAVTLAAGLLGYRFQVQGTVIGGKQLGRTLGYPTANMALPPEATLAPGIYAVRFRRADGTLHDGVASYGYRPTVDSGGEALLETYVFDFSGDLYGETCSVTLFGYLRPEQKFDGLDALVVQMRRDEEEARALLASVQPLGPLDKALNF
ncbi:bifunctional riboflavin kinase/FAD synthetase [Rhizobium sp. EC-SD404]|uniref:bifunctional riboflavin kinase/FAD synthetase n=1 Tax=Rhizobium sp. EC-SD404 TaxID=2038389 RepID=UPI00125A9017|nr:bifunctional riboflavin kinase/FAD synthetase [Rhizobium sp. EC-SD404]VVT06995.1 bifunctional riboflavin kinase and FAD synthetase [Rhizobium sp. EC-SD404]